MDTLPWLEADIEANRDSSVTLYRGWVSYEVSRDPNEPGKPNLNPTKVINRTLDSLLPGRACFAWFAGPLERIGRYPDRSASPL